MKNKKIIILGVVLLFSFTGLCVYAQPGDTNDPLVSKSYVDSRISDILQIVGVPTTSGTPTTTTIPQQPTVVDTSDITRQVLEQLKPLIEGTSTKSSVYAPVSVKKGQTVFGAEGTEIILRSGTAVASINGVNGISDITVGVDLLNGNKVEVNHLLIVPRNDGRGVKVTSDEAWFLVKGDHLVVD